MSCNHNQSTMQTMKIVELAVDSRLMQFNNYTYDKIILNHMRSLFEMNDKMYT